MNALAIYLPTIGVVAVGILFREPLSRWSSRTAARLQALAAKINRYADEHGEKTLSWRQIVRLVCRFWQETG